jgi:enoyl-CoA hydratase/carnithine racemase
MSCATTEPSWRRERDQDEVSTLWFDQPGSTQNLLDQKAIDELESHLVELEKVGAARGLLIRSAKPDGFCAGLDFDIILSDDESQLESFVRRGTQVCHRLSALPFPTTAVIHGGCLGAGLDLALACGHRVALASSIPLQIGAPESQYGLIPAWGSISRLPRLIGPDEGIDLLITGRSIGYLQARALRIVDRLAAESDAQRPADLLGPAPGPVRSWPKEKWEAAWNHAHTKIEDQPGDHPEAQLQILAILSIEIAHGPGAAEQAIPEAFAALAMSETTRDAITMLLRPRQAHPSG